MAEHTVWITLDDDNFEVEVLERAGLVMVDFWTDWQGSCHMMTPVVEHVATAFAGRIHVGRLDIDRHPHVASRYGIHTVPTFLFFSQGEALDQIQGVISTRDLTAKLHALLGSLGS